MFNAASIVIVLLIGLINANAMSLKRSEKSENNLEKVDETQYPLKVNYDVYPVRKWAILFVCGPPVGGEMLAKAILRFFTSCNRSKAFSSSLEMKKS